MVGLVLGAGLGGQGQSQLLAAGLSNNDLLLLDGNAGVLEFSNVEALLLDLVLALDLGDGDGLGDANSAGGGVGQLAGLLLGHSDQRHLVGLGLVLFSAVLVLAMAVAGGSVAAGGTGGHLHGLGTVVISDLGGGAGSGDVLTGVLVGADLTLNNLVGLLAHSQDLVEAVVGIDDNLGGQGDGSHLLGEGGHAHLGVDGGVGVTAVVLGGIAVGGGMVGLVSKDGGGNYGQEGKEHLNRKKLSLLKNN